MNIDFAPVDINKCIAGLCLGCADILEEGSISGRKC